MLLLVAVHHLKGRILNGLSCFKWRDQNFPHQCVSQKIPEGDVHQTFSTYSVGHRDYICQVNHEPCCASKSNYVQCSATKTASRVPSKLSIWRQIV